jgi:hypothetical protein
MTTVRAAVVAVFAAITLVACGGEPTEAEQAPAPSPEGNVSAQACATYYYCDLDNARFTTLSACTTYCSGNRYYCSSEYSCW